MLATVFTILNNFK